MSTALLMVLSRTLEPFANQIHVTLRCLDPAFRLLLKNMQHIYCFLETDSIDCAVCITSIIVNKLKNSGTMASPVLCPRMLAADLSEPERIADTAYHRVRKSKQVLLRRAYPMQGHFARS